MNATGEVTNATQDVMNDMQLTFTPPVKLILIMFSRTIEESLPYTTGYLFIAFPHIRKLIAVPMGKAGGIIYLCGYFSRLNCHRSKTLLSD
jgi:hypothetical protein